jgi:hypothetical protein
MTRVSRREFVKAVAAAPVALASSSWSSAQTVKAAPRLGMNLAGPADWNSELPLVDVFRFARPWISQEKGKAWGLGPSLALDKHGWVTRLAAGCAAETPLCTISGGHYPAGQYTVLFDGEGKLEFSNAKIISAEAGRLIIAPDPSQGGFFLRIVETNPQNYLRHLRVILPGFARTCREHPFHPIFLKRWQGMACLRFMDWMATNGSQIVSWADRPAPTDATFCGKGIALELMMDLSNRLKVDPWFCLPHLADDEYVRNFAKMVKDRLDSGLRVYVEYSNEVWNGMFAQSRYAGEQGIKLKFAEKPWEGAWKYAAYRSVQIFKIWEAVLGGTDRLVRVLASQAGNAYVAQQILPFQDAYKHADALAIAPYITCNVPKEGTGLTTAQVEKWTVEQAMDHLEAQALPESMRCIQEHKKVADKYHLKLVAYEGGQHMVGVMGGENNEAVTRLFHAANAHPRMGQIYARHLEAWTNAGGDLFCNFSSVGEWSKWGSWGVLQHYDDKDAESPKLLALLRWAKQCGQGVALPE